MKYFFDTIQDFLYQGGPVLKVIFITAFLMWGLILERLFYFYFEFAGDMEKSTNEWKARPPASSWINRKIRELELSRLSVLLDKNINHIKTLVALCPLLGLLGTVTGMISVFEVMAEVGTGNARLMAGGISMATIPTMAGMVCALSGLYFSSYLSSKADKKKQQAGEALSL